MDKHMVVCPYNAILLNNKEEWTIDTCNNLNEFQMDFVKWRSQIQKAIQCMILFIWHSRKSKTVGTKKTQVSGWRAGGREEGNCRGEAWGVSGDGIILQDPGVLRTESEVLPNA